MYWTAWSVLQKNSGGVSKSEDMAHVVTMVVDGLGGFVRTLWGLQERRFSITFNAVSSAALFMTMSLAFCFLSLQRYRGAEMGLAFI